MNVPGPIGLAMESPGEGPALGRPVHHFSRRFASKGKRGVAITQRNHPHASHERRSMQHDRSLIWPANLGCYASRCRMASRRACPGTQTCLDWPGSGPKRLAGGYFPGASARSSSGPRERAGRQVFLASHRSQHGQAPRAARPDQQRRSFTPESGRHPHQPSERLWSQRWTAATSRHRPYQGRPLDSGHRSQPGRRTHSG